MKAAVLIPAGGAGRRMGGLRKQYAELLGQPVLAWAIRPFLSFPDVTSVIVALPPEDVAEPPAWLTEIDPRVRVVAGGSERTDSVRAALAAVPPDCELVLVHDAARPLVSSDVIAAVLAAAAEGQAVIAAIPPEDTVKQVDDERRIVATLDRTRLWRAQTPQAFPRALLEEAHRRAVADGIVATDDAALVERLGASVLVVEGSPDNLKITGSLDLALAETILRRRPA